MHALLQRTWRPAGLPVSHSNARSTCGQAGKQASASCIHRRLAARRHKSVCFGGSWRPFNAASSTALRPATQESGCSTSSGWRMGSTHLARLCVSHVHNGVDGRDPLAELPASRGRGMAAVGGCEQSIAQVCRGGIDWGGGMLATQRAAGRQRKRQRKPHAAMVKPHTVWRSPLPDPVGYCRQGHHDEEGARNLLHLGQVSCSSESV